MQALLQAVGRPLAAPSANASGSISPTRAEHVLDQPRRPHRADHRRRPDRARPRIDHRRRDRRRRCACSAPARSTSTPNSSHGDEIEAPGQLASHYAPAKPLRLDATSADADEYLIGFGAIAGDANLSPSGDLVEAAARLFDLLHQADASPKPQHRRRAGARTTVSAPRSTTACTAPRPRHRKRAARRPPLPPVKLVTKLTGRPSEQARPEPQSPLPPERRPPGSK